MTTRATPATPPPAAPARTLPTTTTSWPLNLVTKIINSHARTRPGDSAPAHKPFDRTPASTDGIASYTPGTRVWAYIASTWRNATITEIIGSCALVTYTMPGSPTRFVETVHTTGLQPRDKPARDSHRADPATPDPADTPPAGQALVTLGIHHADEHGMCTGCAYLAHYCWAPCPQARQAMSTLANKPVIQAGAR